jgi:hypothetical protein
VRWTEFTEPAGVNWRFRVPDGEEIEFVDLNLGRQRYVAGKDFDFGDFLVWRRDDVPAYQLAVVVDDAAMQHYGGRAGIGSTEVYGAATAVDTRAGLQKSRSSGSRLCRSRLFSLRAAAGRCWSTACQTARFIEHPAFARERTAPRRRCWKWPVGHDGIALSF